MPPTQESTYNPYTAEAGRSSSYHEARSPYDHERFNPFDDFSSGRYSTYIPSARNLSCSLPHASLNRHHSHDNVFSFFSISSSAFSSGSSFILSLVSSVFPLKPREKTDFSE
ncbi:hypothetical protein GQ457_05G005980 [Hibiscus cannabinus]